MLEQVMVMVVVVVVVMVMVMVMDHPRLRQWGWKEGIGKHSEVGLGCCELRRQGTW